MLKKTITCKDYNGNEYTQDYYFNLNQAQVMEMQLGTAGGLAAKIKKAVDSQDVPTIKAIFKDLILNAYGEISDDGKRFIKSQALRDAFEQTEAYSQLFVELATDAKKAEEFVKAVMPEVKEEAKAATPAPAAN